MSGTQVRIQHQALCPEVDPLTCAVEEIPVHLHDQRITWLRLDPTLTAGLGRGFQLSLSAPFDVRAVRVDYTTLDGAPFDPPYDDIHHRDETLRGPTDGGLVLRQVRLAGERTLLSVGLGTTLPFGKTEEDPFQRTEQGLEHQHLQLGAGAFIPTADLSVLWTKARWGAWFSASGRLPLTENRKGYRAPYALSASLGPSFRPTKPVQLLLTADAMAESAERWHGDPYGGRVALGASATALWTLSPQLVLQAQARGTAHQWNAVHHRTAEEEGSFVQRFVATAGLSWTFGGPRE